MTMTTEEKLAMALQLAEKVVSAANIVSHDGYYELDIDAVTVVLSEAIDRMQERVLAETERANAESYKQFTNGMEAAAEICGSLAETTYDDSDAFEAATGCEASIMLVVREQRKEQAAIRETPHAEG